jgi:hypothetical protein
MKIVINGYLINVSKKEYLKLEELEEKIGTRPLVNECDLDYDAFWWYANEIFETREKMKYIKCIRL